MNLRAALLSSLLVLTGCSVDKMGDIMEAHTSHFPTGRQQARGGFDYLETPDARMWSRTFFTCRSSPAANNTLVLRFGASSDDLPVTIREDSSGLQLVEVDSPRGHLRFTPSQCPDTKVDAVPGRGALRLPNDTGNLKIECKQSGARAILSVQFSRCGG